MIRYAITASPEKNAVEFVSDASPAAPRFRLTYTKTGADTADIRFEIAPPGKPEAFSPYLAAKVKRR